MSPLTAALSVLMPMKTAPCVHASVTAARVPTTAAPYVRTPVNAAPCALTPVKAAPCGHGHERGPVCPAPPPTPSPADQVPAFICIHRLDENALLDSDVSVFYYE